MNTQLITRVLPTSVHAVHTKCGQYTCDELCIPCITVQQLVSPQKKFITHKDLAWLAILACGGLQCSAVRPAVVSCVLWSSATVSRECSRIAAHMM